jgi:hypothetical protein
MKNGIYNISINSIQMTGVTNSSEMLYKIAKMIVEKYENEEDLTEIDTSMELVEEFDPQYEIDENDCEEDELNFDESA